jgi:hypothetical protein
VSLLDTTNSQPNYLALIQLASIRLWLRVNESRPESLWPFADYVIHRKKNLTRHGIAHVSSA